MSEKLLSEKMDNTAGPASYWVDEVRQLEADVDEIAVSLSNEIRALERENEEFGRENAALKQALTLIGDIGYDYDGIPHDLKKLIDEMVGYARNPQSAVDALTAEEQE